MSRRRRKRQRAARPHFQLKGSPIVTELSILTALSRLTAKYAGLPTEKLPPDLSFLRTTPGPVSGKSHSLGPTGLASSDSTWPTTHVKLCTHDGTTPVFSHMGRTFFGARGYNLRETISEAHFALVIDCADQIRPSDLDRGFIESGPSAFLALNTITTPPPIVKLKWPDQQAPVRLSLTWWQRFLALCPQGNIVVCCIGGHGRTGTCLAALLIAATRCTGEEAIATIRTQHCPEAIEGLKQPAYLIALGREAEAQHPTEEQE